MQRITIDPITRLEGHGKIEIFLNDEGNVANTYFQIPELRGFERFCIGRPVEEMPLLTNRICGVCPEAHHMAAAKAVDAVYHVDPPAPAKKLRELLYSAFYCTDHTTHFYALGGPDFIMGRMRLSPSATYWVSFTRWAWKSAARSSKCASTVTPWLRSSVVARSTPAPPSPAV